MQMESKDLLRPYSGNGIHPNALNYPVCGKARYREMQSSLEAGGPRRGRVLRDKIFFFDRGDIHSDARIRIVRGLKY